MVVAVSAVVLGFVWWLATTVSTIQSDVSHMRTRFDVLEKRQDDQEQRTRANETKLAKLP